MSLEELEPIIPQMQSNTSPEPFVLSGEYNHRDFYHAFNSDSAHGWSTNRNGRDAKMIIDLGGYTHRVKAIEIDGQRIEINGQFQSLTEFKLYGSNDGENYELILEDNANRDYYVHMFSDAKNYRFYKITDFSIGQVGIKSMQFYAIPDKKKHVFFSSGEIKVFKEGEWDTLEGELSKETIESHGMDVLSIIPYEKLLELEKPYSILTWTDNEKTVESVLEYTYDKFESKFVEIETDPFSPMERLNQEEEFEVLNWTSDKEFNEEKEHEFTNEQVIDHGKLFKHTLESKEEILDIYVK